MERDTALKILEAILFVSDSPVQLEDLHKVLDAFDRADLRHMVDELNVKYEDHGLHVVEIAEGFQMRTRPEHADWVKKFHKITRSTKLSQAALETLSIIAYRQPLTRQEVEDIRGVDCSGVMKTLLDKGLIKGLGRKKVAGKPVTFGTTKKFLEYFGLIKLTDLPTLKDLPGDEAAVLQEALQFQDRPEPSEEDYESDGNGDGGADAFADEAGERDKDSGEDLQNTFEGGERYESVEDFDQDEKDAEGPEERDGIIDDDSQNEGTAAEFGETTGDEGESEKNPASKNSR